MFHPLPAPVPPVWFVVSAIEPVTEQTSAPAPGYIDSHKAALGFGSSKPSILR